jgi:transposase
MPRGVPHDPSLREEARRLRREGKRYRVISEQLGVPLATIADWCNDPDGKRKTARVASYRGICEECGAPTDGSAGAANAPRICRACLEWPDEAVSAAMQDWASAHGGIPPTCMDWRRSAADHPHSGVCARCRGRSTWNELLLRAGFELRLDRRPETQIEMEALLREGRSTREVADHFGWTRGAIHERLRTRGMRIGDPRSGA